MVDICGGTGRLAFALMEACPLIDRATILEVDSRLLDFAEVRGANTLGPSRAVRAWLGDVLRIDRVIPGAALTLVQPPWGPESGDVFRQAIRYACETARAGSGWVLGCWPVREHTSILVEIQDTYPVSEHYTRNINMASGRGLNTETAIPVYWWLGKLVMSLPLTETLRGSSPAPIRAMIPPPPGGGPRVEGRGRPVERGRGRGLPGRGA